MVPEAVRRLRVQCVSPGRCGVAIHARGALQGTVGRGPLDYLTRWRVELASRRLRQGSDTVAVIARAVGYGSESALSTAFKRVTGISPRDYRGGLRAHGAD